MKSVNRVTILGNVTNDPELKAVSNGQSVATFGIATNRVWRDQTGEKQSLAEFHNLVVWGSLAEFCNQYVKKGKPLFVEGYLKTRTWKNADDVKMHRTEIVIDNVVLLGAREASEAHVEHDDAKVEEVPVMEGELVAA